MKTTSRVMTVETYTSEVRPEVSTEIKAHAEVIAWADAHPTAWPIVYGNKSATFGRSSPVHTGWARDGGDDPKAIIERLWTLKSACENSVDNIWLWRARFTLGHYNEPGFKGGTFQAYDETYSRDTLTLDYTPETLGTVLDRFLAWGVTQSVHKIVRVTLNGACVWTRADGSLIAIASAP